MSLSDTFYVALCMTILILSVVYWFWTQNQYIQRKLNLLENIVYEMKTTLHAPAPDELHIPQSHTPEVTESQGLYQPPPGSELGEDEDIAFETLMEEDVHDHMLVEEDEEAEAPNTDLQPGGIGSGINEVTVPDTNHKSVLDNMTLKELKRLAEQKGIQGVKQLRKPELIEALRNHTVNITPFEMSEETLELA